jgi:hypothetical protein
MAHWASGPAITIAIVAITVTAIAIAIDQAYVTTASSVITDH